MFGGGTVRDITEGGDYSDQSRGAHATGLKHPGGILQLADGRILAADSGDGTVHDITERGPASRRTPLFSGVPHPYGLIEFRGKIYTSFSSNAMVGLAEVAPGAQFVLERHAYAHDFPVTIMSEPYPHLMGCGGSWGTVTADNRLLLGHSGLGTLFDVTPGGHFTELRERRYAWGLTSPLGMTVDPLDGNVYVAEQSTGVIKRIARGGGYSRFAEPLIAGFKEPSCIRFTPDGNRAYICDRGADTVYLVEFEHAA